MITKNVNGNNISQAFIDEIRSDSPDVMARLMLNGSEIECDITNLQVFKGSCGSTTLTLGNVIADRLTASLKNLETYIKGTDIECHIGAWTGSEYEYISLGVFTVSEAKKTRYTTEVTAFSSVVGKSGKLYDPSNDDPLDPNTIAELGAKVATQMGCNITFDSDIDTSQIMMVDTSRATLYQCLQAIAICSGGYIVNDNAGDVYVKRYNSSPTLAVDTGMMVKLPRINEAPSIIDSVLCNGDYTYSASLAELVDERGRSIVDEGDRLIFGWDTAKSADIEFNCDYMTANIFNANIKAVVGYTYWTADVGLTLGDPRLDGTDVLAVTDVDGSVYNIPCHQITHKYTGGFSSTIKSAEPTQKQSDIGSISTFKTTQDLVYEANKELKNMNAYFWFEGEGDDEGAHITQTKKEIFKIDPTGGNFLASTRGISIRDGLDELALFSGNELRVGRNGENDAHVIVTNAGMSVAKGDKEVAYLGNYARIGEENDANIYISSLQTRFHGNNAQLVGMIDSGHEVSGEYEDSLARGILQPARWDITSEDSPRERWLNTKVLTFEPTGDLMVEIKYYTKFYPDTETASYSRSVRSDVDSDITQDGFRIKYTVATRELEVWYIDGYFVQTETTYGLGLNKTSVTLDHTPVRGTQIRFYLWLTKDSSRFVSDDVYFTAGTAATVTASGLAGYVTAKVTYDGNKTFRISNTTSGWSASFGIIYYQIIRSSGNAVSVTYNRNYLSPQYIFGVNCDASDHPLATLFGEGLKAGAENQTVFGKYNKVGTKAFYIGKGISDEAPALTRSNAMEVDWNGDTTIAGTLTQSSDRRLKEHIDYLDEDAVEFIRALKPAHFMKDDMHHTGFYAQDVEESDKWDCMTGEMNGYMTLGYTELIAPLVRYCQKLEERIKTLEGEVMNDGEGSDS